MDYQIKKISFEDNESLQQLTQLQNYVYKNKGKNYFNTEFFKFWYVDNPMGKVISFNAFYGEQLVAHYACIPIKMKINSKVEVGLLDISTVTHPEHRGKGLFKTLAKTTYDYALKEGFKFVVGVANANSFPGYMKYFDFTFISKLDVKCGWGKVLEPQVQKEYKTYWDAVSLSWRLKNPKYYIIKNTAFGKYLNYPFIKTLMGIVPQELSNNTNIKKRRNSVFRPLNLYIGLGADLSKGHYFKLPKFIKHSPFNLIFLDLTGGELPKVTKDNIFFQLLDFDVA